VRLPDEDDFDRLSRCKHLLRLRSLDLTTSGLSSGFGPARLFRSRYLANLTTLIARGDDDNCHLDVPGIRGIVGSKYLGNLRHLDVGANWASGFGDEGTLELLKAGNLTSLERLGIDAVGMGDEGAVALAATAWMRQLKHLDLSHNDIGDRGARALLESPYLKDIQVLDLSGNESAREAFEPIHEDTLRKLRRRFGKRLLL
jgi:hypothetical protein